MHTSSEWMRDGELESHTPSHPNICLKIIQSTCLHAQISLSFSLCLVHVANWFSYFPLRTICAILLWINANSIFFLPLVFIQSESKKSGCLAFYSLLTFLFGIVVCNSIMSSKEIQPIRIFAPERIYIPFFHLAFSRHLLLAFFALVRAIVVFVRRPLQLPKVYAFSHAHTVRGRDLQLPSRKNNI